MDKYVNTDIGIYHIESVCDRKDKDGHKLYHVKCRYCEFESDMRLFNIKQPTICKHKDRAGNIINYTSFWQCQQLRSTFAYMKNRCLNPNDKAYRWYGGNGIGICKEWLDNPKLFEEWALSNGYADGLTIDRIASDKDYSPDNCRWIPLEENSRRAGKVNWITIDDITLTGRQWAEKLGLGLLTIDRYIREYGFDKTKELIVAMLREPSELKHRKPKQTWFAVYGIQI